MATAPSNTSIPLSSSCYVEIIAQDSGPRSASPVFFRETFAPCECSKEQNRAAGASGLATKYGAKKKLLDSRRQSGTMACCRATRDCVTQRRAVSVRGFPPLWAGEPLRNAGRMFAPESGHADRIALEELSPGARRGPGDFGRPGGRVIQRGSRFGEFRGDHHQSEY
jgi:hypothetical protein